MSVLNQIQCNDTTYTLADSTNAVVSKEVSSTASSAHKKGSMFLLYDGLLYEATEDIATNGTITVGTNCKRIYFGDETSAIKKHLTTTCTNTYTWEHGVVDSGSGVYYTSTTARLCTKILNYPISIKADSGYKAAVCVYQADDTYLGILQANGTLAKSANWFTSEIFLDNIGGGYIRIMFALDVSGSSTPISLAESNHLKTTVYTDPFLTQPGIAADAKAAGDRISALETEFSIIDEHVKAETAKTSNGETWSRGTLNPSTGGSNDSTATNRIRTAWSSENIPFGVEPVEGYKVAVYVKVDGTYQGVIQADGSIAKTNYFATDAVWIENISNVTDVRYQLAKTDDSDIALSAGVNLLFRVNTDVTLSQAGKAADAKITGDALQTLDGRISNNEDHLFADVTLVFEQGSISTNSGENSSATSANNPKRVRSAAPFFVKDNYEYVTVPSGFAVTVLTYRDRTATQANYIEALTEVSNIVEFASIKHKYVRFLVAKTDHDALLTPEETANLFKIRILNTNTVEPVEAKVSQAMGVNLLFEGDMIRGVTFTTGVTPIINVNTNFNTTDFIPVLPGETLLAHDFRRFWIYNSEKTGILTKNLNTEYSAVDSLSGVKYLTMPQDAAYIRVSYNYVEDLEPYLYRTKYYDSRYAKIMYNDGQKYLAMGSSTTEGTYSTIGNRDSSGRTEKGFPYWIALENNYTLSNIGHGGGGWLNHGNRDANNALSLLDNILKAQTYVEGATYTVGQCAIKDGDICRYTRANDGYAWESLNLGSSVSEAFSNKNIITLLYGTNDYKAQWKNSDTEAQQWPLGSINERWVDPSYERTVTLGDSTYGYTSDLDQKLTVIGAMSIVIETLAREAPKAQIIIVLPGNFKKLGLTESATPASDEIEIVTVGTKNYAYGKYVNNYAAGTHNWENKTLADYRAAIKECADYYGLNVVDMSKCAANRLNIDNLLGDGIHPTIAYYKQIGHTLAPFIR